MDRPLVLNLLAQLLRMLNQQIKIITPSILNGRRQKEISINHFIIQ
jgi:hypothetical protein